MDVMASWLSNFILMCDVCCCPTEWLILTKARDSRPNFILYNMLPMQNFILYLIATQNFILYMLAMQNFILCTIAMQNFILCMLSKQNLVPLCLYGPIFV